MRRKVIQIAESTQLVSIPRKWAVKHNILKGDELEIVEEADRLCVYTSKKPLQRMKDMDISQLTSVLPKVLHALYKAGFDEVRLTYSRPEVVGRIQQKLQDEMVGFEMIEQKTNCCVIKSFSEGVESEFDVTLRRVFLLLKSMTGGLLEAIEGYDVNIIKSLRRLEKSNNKYTGYCRRIINRGNYSKRWSYLMYCVLEELENIADEIKYLCDYLIENPKRLRELGAACLDLYSQLDTFLNDTYAVFWAFDLGKCVELFHRRKALVKRQKRFNQKTCDHAMVHYFV
ncbi:MAG: hypothetical protein ABIF10_06510, partial [Candidatus Woesearchaeota archaeon]